ncbi:hypothetical protein HBH53_181920 [Parastagonospora nodorum]|nr:hypothetical protein HBH53_181920 [Parastagonospora nodorum]
MVEGGLEDGVALGEISWLCVLFGVPVGTCGRGDHCGLGTRECWVVAVRGSLD